MIKIDMQMPECCTKCPFYSGYNEGKCLAQQDEYMFFSGSEFIERHSNCPLQEVEDDV